MHFIHQTYQPGETIAAVATPPGEGGVAIIRISGNEALAIASKVFTGPVHTYATHSVHYGHIIDSSGRKVDDVLLIPMLGKKSYTGEDTVEICCHGGSLITRKVLEVILQAGARPAQPGEFTFKAYMNGKLDLSQAEAVQNLIHARSELALQAAEKHLQGALSSQIKTFQQDLTHIAAILEAWVDFPDEGLEFASMEEINQSLEALCQKMEKLAATFHDGRIIHDGIALCLIGCPNVGKSSLMNALLDKDRAIVSPTPGTTRDIVEDVLRLNGLNFRLIDTAGIRDTSEHIEAEGIRRSKAALESADLILFLLDAEAGLRDEDLELMKLVEQKKTLFIWNKIDLHRGSLPSLPFPHVVEVSAKEKTGLSELHQAIDKVLWKEGPPSKEEVMITSLRHHQALNQAILGCQKVIQGLQQGISPEFLSSDMRSSLNELGKIIGTNVSEDILSSIFSTFCIGK